MVSGEPRCPQCGKVLEMGYGMAGGGIGAYEYCPEHGVIDKWPDPELSTPEEIEADRVRRDEREGR